MRQRKQDASKQLQNYIIKALRRADHRYPYRNIAIRNAYFGTGKNPKTGRMVKLYKCSCCKELFMRNQIQVDHKDPVVPVDGFDDWNGLINRLFCQAEERQVLCVSCHQEKSTEENKRRK
jgi:hypothetical protein